MKIYKLFINIHSYFLAFSITLLYISIISVNAHKNAGRM